MRLHRGSPAHAVANCPHDGHAYWPSDMHNTCTCVLLTCNVNVHIRGGTMYTAKKHVDVWTCVHTDGIRKFCIILTYQ